MLRKRQKPETRIVQIYIVRDPKTKQAVKVSYYTVNPLKQSTTKPEIKYRKTKFIIEDFEQIELTPYDLPPINHIEFAEAFARARLHADVPQSREIDAPRRVYGD